MSKPVKSALITWAIGLCSIAGVLLAHCNSRGQSLPAPPPIPTVGYPVSYPSLIYLPIVEAP